MLSWDTVSNVKTKLDNFGKSIRTGDGDGATPEDTCVSNNLRQYYIAKSKKTNQPHWPEWMPGPRPAGLPEPPGVGDSYRYDSNIGQNYGSTQGTGRNQYTQQNMGPAGGNPNAVSAIFAKPRMTANAAARSGSAGLGTKIDSRQFKPEPRPIPSQRDYSQQARSQNQQSYAAQSSIDPYNYESQRTETVGYQSNGRPADGYGSRGSTQRAETMANGGYSEPSGYEQRSSRAAPNPYRNGRGPPVGLPTNPRGNR